MLPVFQEPTPPAEPDFGDECREAFHRLCEERAYAWKMRETPGRRKEFLLLHLTRTNQVNDVIDQYLDWRDINAL